MSVELADGSRLAGDLLVAADGVRSRIRPLVDPAAPEGRYVGLTNFGGHHPADRRWRSELPVEAWQMVFGRRAFFGAHRTPDGDVVWFVNVAASRRSAPTSGPPPRRRSGRSGWSSCSSPTPGRPPTSCAAASCSWPATAPTTSPHVPVWHRGRLVLVGDAAHAPSPSSGQGASMALEDAVELARCLRDLPTVEAAFAAYDAIRRERVEKIVAAGARSSSTKTPGRGRADGARRDAAAGVPATSSPTAPSPG